MTSSSTREPGWRALVRLGLAVRPSTLAAALNVRTHGRPLLAVGDLVSWAEAQVEAEPEQPAALYELFAIPPGAGNDRESIADAERTLAALGADVDGDLRPELAKWRVVELSALVERIAQWPLDPTEDFDGRSCSMWSACREVWDAWAEILDRPRFFYPDGQRECSCYDGRLFEDVLAEYRAWIAAECDRLRAADRAIG